MDVAFSHAFIDAFQSLGSHCSCLHANLKGEVKTLPLQAWTGLEGG
jgi:hypothetical protein